MGKCLKDYFKNWSVTKGRTSRGDYWLTVLGVFLISFVGYLFLLILAPIADKVGMTSIVAVITFVVCIGWMILLYFIPFVGSLIIFVLTLFPSVNEGNKY